MCCGCAFLWTIHTPSYCENVKMVFFFFCCCSDRVQNAQGASVFPATMNLQSKESHQKQSSSPFEFGLISSDSLLNPSHKQASYANSSKGFGSYLDFSNQAKNSNVDSWTEELKSDWTQLSMSIPMAPSSPVQDKLALSPLRLSREFDPAIHMGLGVNTEFLEPVKKANNWIPISWGNNNNSMGGPLGEVLNSTTNSPKFGSSPTGVLQKSTFGSLSNSSSGSSTVLGDNSNKNCDGKDPLGPTTLMNSSAPAPSMWHLKTRTMAKKYSKTLCFSVSVFLGALLLFFVVFDIKTEETKGEMDKSSLHLSDFWIHGFIVSLSSNS